MEIGTAITAATLILAVSGLIYTAISTRNKAAVDTVAVMGQRINALEAELADTRAQRDRYFNECERYRSEVFELTRQLMRASLLGERDVGRPTGSDTGTPQR